MSVKIGDKGGIRVGPETTYGTASVGYITQHGVSTSLAPTIPLLPSPVLGVANNAVRKYGGGFVDGEITVAYDDHRSVIGGILAGAGNLVSDDYTIGSGAAPDEWGQSLWVDYGGYVIQYLGAVYQSMRFEFTPDSAVMVTLGFLAQSWSKETAAALTKPSETGILWANDLSSVSIGGTAMCSLTGTVDITFPTVGSDRKCLGSGVIKQPVWAGRTTLASTLNVELSDDTNADSEAILDLFFAGTTLGDIVIGDFTLGAAYMSGDGPALGAGITQFPINVEAQDLVITTQA